MPDSQTIVSIGQLFAEVTEDVETFNETRLDSMSRSLARRVFNETAMYNQLFCKLMLVSHSSSNDAHLWQRIETRLGDKTAGLLATSFQSLIKTLEKLKIDIANINIGTVSRTLHIY